MTVFDYAGFSREEARGLRETAARVRGYLRVSNEQTVAACLNLLDASKRLGDRFPEWVRAEIGAEWDRLRRHLQSVEAFAGYAGMRWDSFALEAMRTLSRPSVPEKARLEAVERAKAGERISKPVASAIVEAHDPPEESEPAPPVLAPARCDASHPTVPGYYVATERETRRKWLVLLSRDRRGHLRVWRPKSKRTFDPADFGDWIGRVRISEVTRFAKRRRRVRA